MRTVDTPVVAGHHPGVLLVGSGDLGVTAALGHRGGLMCMPLPHTQPHHTDNRRRGGLSNTRGGIPFPSIAAVRAAAITERL